MHLGVEFLYMCKLGGFNLKKFTFVILLITLVMFIGLNYFNRPSIENNVYSPEDKRDTYLNIMTCNIAQYKMVKLIVGDKHNVAYMFNNESDMQKYQVSVDAVNNVSNMDLFFYSGQDYEPWGSSLIEKIDKSRAGIIDVSRGIRAIAMDSKTNTTNPYYWLSPEEYKIALYNVKSAIEDKDIQNKDYYEQNYEKAVKDIDDTVKTYDDSIKNVKKYTFIAIDNDLDYFFRKISVTPIYANNQPLDKIIADNKLDKTKVIVIKDSKTQFTADGYTMISLDSFNSGMSFEQLINNNYKIFTDSIKK